MSVRNVDIRPENTYRKAPVKINLNQADKLELLRLAGIGPKKASAIIDYRLLHGPFKSIDDLTKVKGFTKKILAKIVEKNKGVLVVG
jgi:comEA protein